MSENCKGTVMLMDANAKPFERIWCVLEVFVTCFHGKQKSTRQLLDICSIVPEGTQIYDVGGQIEFLRAAACLLMDDGQSTRGTQESVSVEHVSFPRDVSLRGVHVDVSTAQASQQSDKDSILKLTAKDIVTVANTVHEVFAGGALITAAFQGDDAEV